MDRISGLPDELRNRIVSLLPLEDAIGMSCLSRRWRNVCHSLTNLNFDQRSVEPRLVRSQTDFKDLVYQTLQLHDGLDIEKFALLRLYRPSPIHIDSWVSFAVNHNVKEFDLSLMSFERVKLPFCLLTSCKTLRVLTLTNVCINFSETVGFHQLETLKLISVSFTDEDSPNCLFSSCLHLEKLFISGCYLDSIEPIRISSHNLKSITLFRLDYKSEIEISAPTLRELFYCGKPPNMSEDTLASLLTVNFQCSSTSPLLNTPRDVFYRASDIMMGLHNVSRMTLGRCFVEFLTWGQASSALQPSFYHHLHHLQLDMYPCENQVQLLISLLTRSPKLKHFFVSIQDQRPFRNMINTVNSWQVQEMFTEEASLKSLKTVNIEFFQGSNVELGLVKYLIENADSLEKMDIGYYRKAKDITSMRSIKQKISRFTKASPGVVISVKPPLQWSCLKQNWMRLDLSMWF